MATRGETITAENAQMLAVKGLSFIANDAEILNRFMSLTGLSPDELRLAAGEPGFLAGVLSFLMDHEALLLAFAATAGIPPHHIAGAHHALSQLPVCDS
jgi:hypothetical protein